jgi:putative FmdB family regulatory protein
MPLYEYLCDACGRRFEKIHKFSDPAPDPCPHCGKGPVKRQLSSPAIQFKGSGFYITDYAKKGAVPAEASSPAKSEGTTEKKSEGGDSAPKSGAAKSDAAPAPAAPAAAPAKSSSDS